MILYHCVLFEINRNEFKFVINCFVFETSTGCEFLQIIRFCHTKQNHNRFKYDSFDYKIIFDTNSFKFDLNWIYLICLISLKRIR